MANLHSLARMTTATTGAGTITLGAAVSGYLSFASAGVQNGEIIEYAISDGANCEIGTGTYTSSGTTLTRNVTLSTNSNAAINLSGSAQVIISPRAERLQIPRSYLAGLTLSTAGSSATYSVAAGQAADSSNLEMLSLASSISKTTGAWAVGSGNGSLDTGTIAISTWYHVFLIYRPDTQVVDVLCSLSAASPTLPSSYTLFRRIGSMKTDGSSHWLAFVQFGDEFLWSAPINEQNGATVPTSATLITLAGAPSGVQVQARFRCYIVATGAVNALFQSPDEASAVSNATNGNTELVAQSSGYSAGNLTVRTNTSSQVRWSASTTGCTGDVATFGWIDSRGKFN